VAVLLEESERAGVKSFVHISSIAVMNHFVDHVGADESLPLPHPSEYRSPYDATKRLGEEKVLAVKSDMWSLSIRCGGIISSHRAMQFMGLYEKTGILLWAGKPIDTTHGVNVAWAVHLALGALQSRRAHVNREVFYVTGEPLNQLDVAVHMTSRLGNTYRILPVILVQLILGGMWLVHSVKRLCACICGVTVPAIGLHQFVQMGKYSQTFSNEKARRVLKYTPILSTDEAFDRIVAEYRASLTS
jgi:nucleoside-diphosphate-sugar epimerase